MRSTQPGGRLDREALGVAIEIADGAIAGRKIPRRRFPNSATSGWSEAGPTGQATDRPGTNRRIPPGAGH